MFFIVQFLNVPNYSLNLNNQKIKINVIECDRIYNYTVCIKTTILPYI